MRNKKKVVVLGASLNPTRYGNIAIKRLTSNGHEVIAIGRTAGNDHGVEIRTDRPLLEDVHTVTLYLTAKVQVQFMDYIKSLNPKRVIFNPGTEHGAHQKELATEGIEVLEACTLVMLSTGQF